MTSLSNLQADPEPQRQGPLVWTLREDEPIDHAMIKRRVQAGVLLRANALRSADPQALVQLIDGEKDGLPGLLVYSYGGIAGYLVS